MPEGNALVLHAGGPTAVLNASLAGIADGWREQGIARLYGAVHGAAGLLAGSLADLSALPPKRWQEIALAPGSLLGTSRRNLAAPDSPAVFDVLRRYDIRYVLPTGGNGTMAMALALTRAAQEASYEAIVVGVPKTIDNDLAATDHSPGYPSAARFFAFALRDIGPDNRALPTIAVVEILGRNAGWIAAATILARHHADDAPHLIYVPERRMSFDQLAADVEHVYRKHGRAVIAVCEGQLDERGEPFGADTRQTGTTPPLAMNLACSGATPQPRPWRQSAQRKAGTRGSLLLRAGLASRSRRSPPLRPPGGVRGRRRRDRKDGHARSPGLHGIGRSLRRCRYRTSPARALAAARSRG
jgi:6-phosphofructokinase